MFFRQLEYLVALSTERHFVRAAQSCRVSQPTLSEGIRRLEDELGIPLIRRGNRFEGLTAEGEEVLAWAKRILADRDALLEGAASLAAGLTGRLRMGSIPTASAAVSLISSQFHRRHPHARVQVVGDLRSDDDAAFSAAGAVAEPEVETDSVASLFAHVKAGRWATVLPCAWLHVFDIPEGMAAAPLVEPVRKIPVGLVTLAQETASAMALAAVGAAAETDLSFLEQLPQ